MISLYRNKSSLLTCFDFTLLLQKIVEKSSKEKIKVMKKSGKPQKIIIAVEKLFN